MSPMLTTETSLQRDLAQLQLEIDRYLAAVEAFRAEGNEPAWRAEASWRSCA